MWQTWNAALVFCSENFKFTWTLQYYMDPVLGYVFRSKKDVMRYLQTGDIRSCAVKPTKRDPGSTMKDSSVSLHLLDLSPVFPIKSICAICSITPVIHVTDFSLRNNLVGRICMNLLLGRYICFCKNSGKVGVLCKTLFHVLEVLKHLFLNGFAWSETEQLL